MAIGARLRAAGCWSLSRTQFVANLSAMAPLERDLEQASPSTPVGSIFNLRPSSNDFSWSGQLATPASPAPAHLAHAPPRHAFATRDRKSVVSGKRWQVPVYRGGRRIIKKKE